jgi:FtsH-binding integral membrane protein
MTTMRKVGLWGVAIPIVVGIILHIAGIPAGIAAVHALPFCMLLLFDLTNSRSRSIRDEQEH